MEREILKLTQQEAQNIVNEDHEDFHVIKDDITSTGRWTIYKDAIVKRISDGKLFKTSYSVGATESQDQYAYDYDEPIFKEVIPKEVVVIKYAWEE